MQHAVGAPLPPPDPSGWTPGAHGAPVGPGAHGSPGAGHPPVPPVPHGGPQSAPPQPHPHPHAVPTGQHPAGAPAPHGAHPAPPAPGWTTGAVPPHPGQPGPPPRDTTGHVQLPPVAIPAPPAADPGTGTATLAVLLIGPAGAGKTTVARHWAARRRVPTAHISLDDVREWVCSGFADPQSGWNEHSEAQYRLARRTCGFAARNFLANGISCILDDAVFPDRPVVGLGGWKRHVGPGLLPVVLLPGLEIVLERNAERSGNRRLSDEEVASIHGRMAGWYGSGLPIIDNSKYDVETTARVLDEVLARSIASPPAW
ncbi:AAA family ATPase [Streptomyces sp. NPDC059875]|uniref:AAA family ATPase n=1 Tax=unclassified Streptomyces TaxID=2593676 RepID=UPI0036651BF4